MSSKQTFNYTLLTSVKGKNIRNQMVVSQIYDDDDDDGSGDDDNGRVYVKALLKASW